MFKIKIFILLLFLGFQLFAQEVFNPNEQAFFSSLNNDSVAWIKYNKSGKYKYSDKNFDIQYKKRINFLFTRDKNLKNEIILKNLDFSNCGEIIFWIRHRAKIKILNCTFSFGTNSGIKFYFDNSDYLYPVSNTDTEISIDSCTFNHHNLRNISQNFVSQLYFSKDIYPKNKNSKIEYSLNSVQISNCKFNAQNFSVLNNSHFQSILFFRKNSNVTYSNITIKNSLFDYKNFRNGISEGINFSNNINSNFREEKVNYYINNRNIKIISNDLITDSKKPGHAIFIQGPFKYVKIENNYIKGFGLNMLQNTNTVVRDGVIHIYGARQSSKNSNYANNLDSIIIKNNILFDCKSIGIRLSGFSNSVVSENIVDIGNESSYWEKFSDKQDISGIEISTGDYYLASKQSIDAVVNSNIIFCNNQSIGILIKFVKNFSINYNTIYQPSSYGILYFANKNVATNDVGISSVAGNFIDMQNQKFESLKSGFFNNHFNIKFAAINFWREDKLNSRKNFNESLTVKNNEIKISDKRIKKIEHNLNFLN